MQVDLFTPVKIGEVELKNRIVMSPMTRARCGMDGVPGGLQALYYAQRASAGLIITEGTWPTMMGRGYRFSPGIENQAQTNGWKLVTDAVHIAGGRIFLQVWHAGRIAHSSFLPDRSIPIAPSAIAAEGTAHTDAGIQPLETPRAIERDGIPGIVKQHTHAAVNAVAAGFDGVEIHAANGYLLDEFLRDRTNRRTDDYGGSKENRARLLLEIVDSVVSAIGAHRVGVRIGPQNTFHDIDDSNPQALYLYVARELGARKLAYLHVIEGDMSGKPAPSFDYRAIKDAFGGPYIANFQYDKQRAEVALANGSADLVSFGKPFIANPDLVLRLKLNAPLAAPAVQTLYGGGAAGYTDYPTLDALEKAAA